MFVPKPAHRRLQTILLITTFAAIVLVFSTPAHSQVQTTAASGRVDAILDKLKEPGMPGCAVGIVQHGSLTLARSYGLADVENGIPIDSETRFDIGSMSKQFLAMAILMLAAEGKLGLDEDVRKYVPELRPYKLKITLSDLMHHTSGLKDYDQLLQAAGWVDGDLKSVNDVKWIIERQNELAFKPGNRYSYSDSNYFLLGSIVERVTRKPVATFLDQLIFRPLGMTHTSLRNDRWALIPHKAWPYLIQDGKPRFFINAEEPLGDGGIFSTVGDLALWERNFDDHKVGGARVIEEMQRVIPLADGTANDYAAGLYIRRYGGLRLIEHSGASYGYLAEKLRFPEKQLSVIVLCNRRDGPYVDLGDRVANLFLGLKEPYDDRPPALQTPKAEINRFAATYFSDAAADGVLIEARDGAIFDVGDDREYRQTGPLTFMSSPSGTLCRCSTSYIFELASDGNVKGFSASRPSGSGVGKQPSDFYARMQPNRSASLSEYTGEYMSDDVATAWCVYQKSGGIFVRRRGFADRPLQLLWQDAAAGPSGILQFQRRANAIDGFLLRNIRLNSVEFRKLPTGQHPVPAPWTCPRD